MDAGRVSMERLDESVYRILAMKDRFGLTDEPVDEDVDVAALNEQIAALTQLLTD